MKFYMPTILLDDEGIVLKSENVFKKHGKKALIVTGKNSAKLCGALDDVISVLDKCEIKYSIFDKVKENPPISQAYDGALVGKDADFVIAIGGGSPMDAGKGMAVLIKHGTDDYVEKLFGAKNYDAVPVIAIPTTAGTGSEATPYAVFTDDKLKTKQSMARKIFPAYSLIDVNYFMTMPKAVRNTTVIDAFTHAVESYINVNSTAYSELYALKALELFGKHKDKLADEKVEKSVLHDLIIASTYAGVAIAQTGTSLPHGFGYPITYQFSFSHGMANAIFMTEFFKMSPKDKVGEILDVCGFESIESFDKYIKAFIALTEKMPAVKEADIDAYVALLMQNKAKLKNHPLPVTRDDVVRVYQNAVL